MADVSAFATNRWQDLKRSHARSARQEAPESGEASAVAALASPFACWAVFGARHLASRANPVTAPRPEGRGFLLQAAAGNVPVRRKPPQAESDSPSAFSSRMPCRRMFTAALMSRSCSSPQDGHVQRRTARMRRGGRPRARARQPLSKGVPFQAGQQPEGRAQPSPAKCPFRSRRTLQEGRPAVGVLLRRVLWRGAARHHSKTCRSPTRHMNAPRRLRLVSPPLKDGALRRT